MWTCTYYKLKSIKYSLKHFASSSFQLLLHSIIVLFSQCETVVRDECIMNFYLSHQFIETHRILWYIPVYRKIKCYKSFNLTFTIANICNAFQYFRYKMKLLFLILSDHNIYHSRNKFNSAQYI